MQRRTVSKKFSLPTSLILLIGLAAAGLPVQGTTYYVTKSGNDSNGCTQAQPCLTITRGSKVATKAGDIVQVGPGTYSEQVTLTTSGSAAGKITFRGHDGSGCPTVSYNDINSRGVRPAPTVTMNGFTVSASWVKLDCFNTNGNGVLDISAANIHDVDVVNNYSAAGAGGSVGVYINDQLSLATSAQNIYVGYNFISGGGYGVLQKCRNCKFEYNEFFQMNPGSSGADGDYARIFGYDITFYKNYMHGNDRNLCGGADCHIDCFQTFAYTADYPAYNITIDSNVCFHASEGIIATNEAKLSVFHDWTIKNNLIAYAPLNYYGAQCMIISDISNVAVYNNTCANSGVVTYAKTTTGYHRNNIHHKVGTYLAYRMIEGASVTADHNLLYDPSFTYSSAGDIVNVNPLFVNEALNDYQLQSSSRAKDAGANVPVTLDLLGNMRPFGAGYDIGAYEYGAGTGGGTVPLPPATLQLTVN